MPSWNLSAKFSVLLVLVFCIGSVLTVFTLSKHLNTQAEEVVKERAEILLSTMQSARDYTQNHVQAVLNDNDADRLVLESIPTFAAQIIFEGFRQRSSAFQDFSYKEAALNPTNPDDKADDFESQLFNQLQGFSIAQATPNPQALSGYRTQDQQKLFYIAQPIFVKDRSCLQCHGDPAQAPPALIAKYGDKNGFGWQINDLVATQIIYVPANNIFERGRQNLWTVTKIFLGIFAAIALVINLLLWRTVIRPLAVLTQVAQQISRCSIELAQNDRISAPNLAPLASRRDEPGQLARAFDYMLYVQGQREQDLQQAVQTRTQSLETEMHERRAAQNALQTYTHAINHDLRNLVMGISMVVQGTLISASDGSSCAINQSMSGNDEPSDPASPITVEPMALKMIQKSCDRQLNLMNSLVDVNSSEIWRTVLHLETTQLQTLIPDLIETITTTLPSNATLSHQLPQYLPCIQADPIQLKRVFENLINNALKYNPNGVDITLGAIVVESYDGKRFSIRCTVTDNGIGVDANEKQELFNIYVRGKDVDRRCAVGKRQILGGEGLGLYICRKIIDAHGGNIGLETAADGGAIFWFTLPV
ncbi:MAG: DUF3365 domain-containing protein [Cyanobacteria bacterium P01_D01_bin.44]